MSNDSSSRTRVEKSTIGHYDQNAQSFFDGTVSHDVTQNYAALLDEFPEGKSLNILDFGCGPGRDLHYFKKLGHNPTGLDGSKKFCEMARNFADCTVLNQRFTELDLPSDTFDAVFANASLFHVPKDHLSGVLDNIHHTLRLNGILFMSNPRGNSESWSDLRYGNYMEFEAYEDFLQNAGFSVLHHYYRPAGLALEQQPWLAIVCKRDL